MLFQSLPQYKHMHIGLTGDSYLSLSVGVVRLQAETRDSVEMENVWSRLY